MSVRRVLSLLRPEAPLIAGAAVLAAAGAALTVAGPRVLGAATDAIVAGDLASSGRHLAVAVVLFLAGSGLGVVQGLVATEAVQRAMGRLRARAQAKLDRLPLHRVDSRPRGELLSRVTGDIDNLGQSLQQTVGPILVAVFHLVGLLGMMLWISPLLALISLASIPLSTAAASRVTRRAAPRFAAQWKATGDLNAHIEDVFTGHTVVRAYGREAEAAQRFAAHNARMHRAGLTAQILSGLARPVMAIFASLGFILIAVIGAFRIASGALSLGEVQAFVQYSQQSGQPINQVAGMAAVIQSALASAARVLDHLDDEEEPAEPTGTPAPLRGRVEFRDVSFRYDPEIPLLEDIDLAVEPGQTVAVVGPTGSGKTTLVNLLLRFHDATGGRITVDGADITAIPRKALRSGIGLVLQDTWLFHGTIAANLAYGSPSAGRAEVEAAARTTRADPFIRALPDGYDTVIGEGGTGLSEGERQLLALTRAHLADPALLILDEATSSLDTRTERLVQDAMRALRRGRTTFVIAHRLSTIRDADRIVYLSDGRILEQGTHHDLLAADGPYAALHSATRRQAPPTGPHRAPVPQHRSGEALAPHGGTEPQRATR
ncbi:ABC transporter ATP-binding protein [Actinocorallia aurea]